MATERYNHPSYHEEASQATCCENICDDRDCVFGTVQGGHSVQGDTQYLTNEDYPEGYECSYCGERIVEPHGLYCQDHDQWAEDCEECGITDICPSCHEEMDECKSGEG